MPILDALACAALGLLTGQDMTRRLDSLRPGARKLSLDSFVEQALPVFFWTFVGGMALVTASYLLRLIRDAAQCRRLCARAGLSKGECERVARLARAARVHPRARILRAMSCFEHAVSGTVAQGMARRRPWRKEAEALRVIAHKLGFVASPMPCAPADSREIGAPWPVEIGWAGTQDRVPGLVSTDTRESFTVILHDPSGVLPHLRPGDLLTVHPSCEDGPGAGFDCEVKRAWSDGTGIVVRLLHPAEPTPPPPAPGRNSFPAGGKNLRPLPRRNAPHAAGGSRS